MDETGAEPAPAECFKQNLEYPKNEFELGMKLEARDPRNPSSTCIATVVGLLGLRIKLRLDGTDNTNDFFELVDSQNIHPSGFCQKMGELLQPPLGFRRSASQFQAFQVSVLKDAVHAPESAFKKPPPSPRKNLFKEAMKLEAVDLKNPRLICPATIGKVDGQKVLISFDGWKGAIDYWCQYTSRDLFPVGWCEKTGHPLQPPGDKVPSEYPVAKRAKIISTPATGASHPPQKLPSLKTPPPCPSSAKVDRPPTPPSHLNDPAPTLTSYAFIDGIEDWSIDQVIDHLLSIDQSLQVHADIFKSHVSLTLFHLLSLWLTFFISLSLTQEIDGKALLLLTGDMMMKFMGLKLGPALKICRIIDVLKAKSKKASLSDR